MHITLETDYAIRIVQCLVNAKKRLDAKTISEQANVTLRFSLKILRKLVSTGVIKSYKGTQGGYELNRPAEEISLYDVVETIEGTYVFSRCLDSAYTCMQEEGTGCSCGFRDVFEDISETVREKLKAVHFAPVE